MVPTTPSLANDSAMRVKSTGKILVVSEAEALRKDPLKNYGVSASQDA
jgi:hypothetical protein